jgi:hypothetical protein
MGYGGFYMETFFRVRHIIETCSVEREVAGLFG